MNNDMQELTALNRDYVASVQNCDVKRFDEILAQDFYCSNPDKSLVDRSGFLKQTAVPVTIRNLRAEDVKIRVLGDFAIIHAATRYTTTDGQEARGSSTRKWLEPIDEPWILRSRRKSKPCSSICWPNGIMPTMVAVPPAASMPKACSAVSLRPSTSKE